MQTEPTSWITNEQKDKALGQFKLFTLQNYFENKTLFFLFLLELSKIIYQIFLYNKKARKGFQPLGASQSFLGIFGGNFWKLFGNCLGILLEFSGNSWRIVWGCMVGGFLLGLFGNSLGIL